MNHTLNPLRRQLFAASFLCLCVSFCRAAALPEGVAISLKVPTQRVQFVGDPVSFELQLQNSGGAPVYLAAPYTGRIGRHTVQFFIAPPGANTFTAVESPGIYFGPFKLLSRPRAIEVMTLMPGTATNVSFQLDYDCPTIERKKYLFSGAGTYRIRAHISLLPRSPENARTIPGDSELVGFETAVAHLVVEAPNNDAERAAHVAFQKIPHMYVLYAPDQYYPLRESGTLEAAEEFVKQFPNSHYCALAKYFLAYQRIEQTRTQRDLEAMNRAVGLVQEIAGMSNAPLAVIQYAQKLLRALEVQRETAAAAAQPNVGIQRPKVMVDAFKELESQWYDVKGFTRRSPAGQKAYVAQLLPLHEELAGVKISQEEFDRRHAELLKECVRKFSSPLAPEEWKKRYEEYAAQEARDSAQRAAQDESARRRIIEQLERPTQPKQ